MAEGIEQGPPREESTTTMRPWMPWEKKPGTGGDHPGKQGSKDEEPAVSRELVARAKESFSMYDHDNDDCIDTQHVMNALRGAGYNPAEDELISLMRQYGPKPASLADEEDQADLVDFNTFMNILTKVSRVGDTEEEQEEAFSVWDRVGTGSINAMLFRRIMTTRGEKLTDEDVDDMMSFVKIGEKGEFKYNELIKAMMSE